MKQYILFAFWNYYPSGGMDDMIDSFDTLQEAEDRIKELRDHYEEYQIFDTLSKRIMKQRDEKRMAHIYVIMKDTLIDLMNRDLTDNGLEND